MNAEEIDSPSRSFNFLYVRLLVSNDSGFQKKKSQSPHSLNLRLLKKEIELSVVFCKFEIFNQQSVTICEKNDFFQTK